VLVLPAVDIKDGKCVRLVQGDFDRVLQFDASPADAARRWWQAGAKMLHIVDLDGAREGNPVNTDAIEEIAQVVGVPFELAGGLRSDEAVEAAFKLGAARVVVGSRAFRDRAWLAEMARRFPGKVALAVDARKGMVSLDGWRTGSSTTAADFIRQVQHLPLAAVNYTDISHDGMMSGPNLDATAEIIASARVPVVAGGGVTTIDDVIALREMGAAGVIVGRALFEGALDLGEVLAVAGTQPELS